MLSAVTNTPAASNQKNESSMDFHILGVVGDIIEKDPGLALIVSFVSILSLGVLYVCFFKPYLQGDKYIHRKM